MQVFVFDLVHYGKNLDHLKVNGQLPAPLGKRYFEPDVAIETYADHLDAWVEIERLGYDGIGVNEHHTTPYGLMNSPNLLVASAAQRTSRLKFLLYGNLLPVHEPLRLAEEIAMLDCLSRGRVICGVARGIPREYRVFNIPMAESKARFDECFEIMRRAWTEEAFTYEGRFHSYRDISIWPRPVQQPYPPVWLPVTGSKESIEWAAERNIPITPGVMAGAARDDIIRHYAACLGRHGHRITPGHLNILADAYVADSKAQAVAEYGPHLLYFHNTLLSFDHVVPDAASGYSGGLASPPPPAGSSMMGRMSSMEDVARRAETAAWGTPDEVAERLIEEAEATGAETLLVSLNRGAMPQEMFLNQIRRFGTEVLPRLQAKRIRRVPAAEAIGA
jgi:alkanesulfonate monooxygenase SsuD/methylene tetrahydromethanopterin reductase-like flavin-dependent oxidoreductase (luciferase family)